MSVWSIMELYYCSSEVDAILGKHFFYVVWSSRLWLGLMEKNENTENMEK